jgi:hypothetical protein
MSTRDEGETGGGRLMAQPERTVEAMNAFWVCLEELILAHKADKLGEPAPVGPSKWKSFPLIADIPVLGALVLMAAFRIGRDYQKEHGAPGE